jgi:Holliday junction resolvasome RuvABC endonuclease subunit
MIVGLDVAFRSIGWVKLDLETFEVVGAGCLHTDKRAGKKHKGVKVADDDVRCCAELAEELAKLISRMTVVAAEIPTGGAKGDRASRSMGMATGVIAAVCTILGVPAIWISPMDSKKTSTGARFASKSMMAAAAKAKFPTLLEFLTGKLCHDEHICDAACAVAAAESDATMRRIRARYIKK